MRFLHFRLKFAIDARSLVYLFIKIIASPISVGSIYIFRFGFSLFKYFQTLPIDPIEQSFLNIVCNHTFFKID